MTDPTLKTCPHCRSLIDPQATVCPHCTRTQPEFDRALWKVMKMWALMLGIPFAVLVVIVVVTIMGGDGTTLEESTAITNSRLVVERSASQQVSIEAAGRVTAGDLPGARKILQERVNYLETAEAAIATSTAYSENDRSRLIGALRAERQQLLETLCVVPGHKLRLQLPEE